MAGSGRRVFSPGEVLTASNTMNYLMDQAVMSFAGTAARGSAIGTAVSEGMVSYLADTNAIEVYDGSLWKQVYPAAPVTGNIIQVVSTAKTDVYTTTSASFTAVTGLSVSITPKFSTSKILVLSQIAYGLANANSYGHFKVTRGGTNIYVGNAAGSRISDVYGGYTASDNNNAMQSGSISYLDSPGTTSPVTYQVEVRAGISGTVCVNRSGADTDNANHGRGASSITVLEIAG